MLRQLVNYRIERNNNSAVFDGKSSTISVPLLERCIFEQVIFDHIRLVVIVTFAVLISKYERSVFVPNRT